MQHSWQGFSNSLGKSFPPHRRASIPGGRYHSRLGKQDGEGKSLNTCTHTPQSQHNFQFYLSQSTLQLSTSRCCCLLSESHILLWMLHGSWMNHFRAQNCSTNKYTRSSSRSYAACVSKVIYRGKIRTGNFFPKYPKRKCCHGNEADKLNRRGKHYTNWHLQ